MITAMPVLVEAVEAAPSCLCSSCGRVDSDGTRGPSALRAETWGYTVRERWLCSRCSRQVWGAYLGAVRARMRLVRVSRLVGYPVTRAQADAYEQALQGVQLGLWGQHA